MERRTIRTATLSAAVCTITVKLVELAAGSHLSALTHVRDNSRTKSRDLVTGDGVVHHANLNPCAMILKTAPYQSPHTREHCPSMNTASRRHRLLGAFWPVMHAFTRKISAPDARSLPHNLPVSTLPGSSFAHIYTYIA